MSRLPTYLHQQTPWRVHEIAEGFDVEDLWSFRTPGADADDFDTMIEAIRSTGPPGSASRLSSVLFEIRWKLGAVFDWDSDTGGLGVRVRSLHDRLPADLLDTAGDGLGDGAFSPLYRLSDEFVSELANRTVHAVMHLGWVCVDSGYELRMAVLVRPNGRFGRLYTAAILPFRRLVIYPTLNRQWEQAWVDR